MIEEVSVEVFVKVGEIEVRKVVSVKVFHGQISQELFDRLHHLVSKLTYNAVCAEM